MANYAVVKNGEVVEWHDTLPTNWGHINGLNNLPPDMLIRFGWYPVVSGIPQGYDTNIYELANRHGIVRETDVVERYDLVLKNHSEIERNLESSRNAFLKEIREVRDQLLAATDWTQLADSPINGNEWAAYRQSLRDLPKNANDQYSVKDCLPMPPVMFDNLKKFY